MGTNVGETHTPQDVDGIEKLLNRNQNIPVKACKIYASSDSYTTTVNGLLRRRDSGLEMKLSPLNMFRVNVFL